MSNRLVIPALVSVALLLAGCEALPTGAASTDKDLAIPPTVDVAPRSGGVAAEAFAEFGAAVMLHEESNRLLAESQGPAARGKTDMERRRLEQQSAELWSQAVVRYKKALAIDPASAAVCERLSTGLLDRGDAAQGLRYLSEAARLDPGNFVRLYRLGAQYERAGRVPEAVEAYARAERATLADDDERRALPLVVLKIASLQESQGKLADAVATYERFMKLPKQPDALYAENPGLLELMKNYAPVWRKLGELRKKLGKPADAVAAYREALKLQPEGAQVLLRIAEVHRDAGQFQAAVDACKEYVEREPNRLDGMAFLVELYKAMGETSKAVVAAQDFLREKPFLYQLHYLLGTLYESQGDAAKARAEYETIVRDGKRFVPAYTRLAELDSKGGKPEAALAVLARGLSAGIEDEPLYGELDRRVVEAAKAPDSSAKFRLAVEPARQDFAFYFILGRLEQEMKRYAQAAAAFREAVRLKPEFTNASLRLAGSLIADNHAKEAADVLREAAKREAEKDPKSGGNMMLWRFLADAELAAGNTPGAVEAMGRVVALDPENEANTALYLSLMDRAGQLDAAEAFLERRIAGHPDDPDRWVMLYAAFLIEHDRKLDRARKALEDALAEDPENVPLTVMLGQVFMKRKEYGTAADAFRRAVEHDAENVGARAWLAQAFEEAGKLDEAEKTLREALRVNPGSGDFETELGRFLVRTRRASDEGVALLRKAAAASPDDPAAALAVASAYTHLKRHAEALPVLLALVQKHPDYKPARYSLAMTWDELKDFPKAEAELRGMLAKDPDDDMAANALGYLYAEKGICLDEAKRLLEVALKRQPENGAYLDSMGWVFYRKGDFAKALEYLQKAFETEKDAVIAEHLGDTCWRLGRRDDALAHYEAAAKLDADGQTAAAKKVEAVKAGKDPLLVTK